MAGKLSLLAKEENCLDREFTLETTWKYEKIKIAEWVLCTMVHMDLALEEGGESQGQGHHSTEAEERIREVIWGNNFTTTRTDLLRCGLTTWRMSSRRFAGLSQTSPMLPWTLSFPGSWRDPSESSSQHQTTSIRWVTDTNEVLIISYEIIFFQLLRCNVDLLKIIQLGLTFFNKEGETPEGVCTWQVRASWMIVKPRLLTDWSLFQFNFKFNLSEDMYAEDSVELLQVLIKSQRVGKLIVMSWFVQNSGIQFERHEREGIETVHFAEILLVSGIVLLDNVKWLSFHSGYDFGYLLRYIS